MPEGHTIHRLARDHLRDLRGESLTVTSPQGRAVQAATVLDGARIEAIDGYGKHLLYRWSTGDTLHVHLGLYGRFIRQRTPAEPPRGLKRLRLAGDRWTTDLSGPTACELFDPDAEERLLARLGPDPLRADADPDRFLFNLSRRRIPIGAALLDQSVIAGIGNVYRAEILHVLAIDPARPARELSEAQARAVWDTAARMLADGVRQGRIVTQAKPPGAKRLARGEALHVYRRHACATCGGPVTVGEMASRRLFSCVVCQQG